MRSRQIGLTLAVMAVTGVLAVSAMAQAGGGAGGAGGGGRRGGGGGGFGQRGGGGFGGPQTIATIPVEFAKWGLTLTDDQVTKIKAIQDKVNTDRRAMFQPDASGQRPDFQALQPKMKEMNDKAVSDIEAVLTPAQKGREDAVVKAADTYSTVRLPLGVVPDLKLTKPQNTDIATLAADVKKQNEGAMKDFQDAQGDQTKMQALRQAGQDRQKATADKLTKILTADQNAAVDKWNKDHPRGNRGGGGGNRRPGAGTPAGGPPAI